jgi:hypothetical protein
MRTALRYWVTLRRWHDGPVRTAGNCPLSWVKRFRVSARHKMPCVKSSISDTVIRGHFHAVVVLLFPEIPPISEFLEKIPCTIVRQW